MAAAPPDDLDDDGYDELSMLRDNAEEVGLAMERPPVVGRAAVGLGDGRALSALVWGSTPPDVVLLHGGAQNAHTWDTVILALGRPAVALDLPGHGHSADRRGGPDPLAEAAADVEVAVRVLAPSAAVVVGMSLGGLTAIALAARAPDLVRRLVLVDITPGVTPAKASAIIDFVQGPESFESFEAMVERTVAHNPGRSLASLRRGVRHNAVRRPDGRWVWRHARGAPTMGAADQLQAAGGVLAPGGVRMLWDRLSELDVPVMLVRGTRPQSVVDDADEAELRRRVPGARVEHVDAGHSVQGDDPVRLARLVEGFAFGAGVGG